MSEKDHGRSPMSSSDWRDPELRREAFQRSYTHSLKHLNFPGMVYSMLPAIADEFGLDDDGRAWLAWLNGNTQNAVTSLLILEAAPNHHHWGSAVDFWNDNFKLLEWDIDRRHQKSKFGEATERWIGDWGKDPAGGWYLASDLGWEACWGHSISQPYMGRISAWSNLEFAKILLPFIPDVGSWFLKENSSRSHRNSLCLLSGYDDAWGWDREKSKKPFELGLLPQLHDLAEDLLSEALERNPDNPHVTRLTLESALCTFKSWHKPDRRYPNVYSDMMYQRIKKAESRFGRTFDLLWDIRKRTLPDHLRLEDNPRDPGLHKIKQNWFRETGEVPMMSWDFPDMENAFDDGLRHDLFPVREDPKW